MSKIDPKQQGRSTTSTGNRGGMSGEKIIYQSLEDALKRNGLRKRTRKNVQITKSLDTNNFA